MSDSKKVKDYMTRNVITVTSDMPIQEIKDIIKKTGHDGFPVEEDSCIVGMITASDLLIRDVTPTVEGMMSEDIVIANEELTLSDASRVMFRMGISRLPVTNEDGKVLGIITNTDIIRSHIERSTPEKVNQFRSSLEGIYTGLKTTLTREKLSIDSLIPTQGKVYGDELEGRTYEIERGLAEPILTVEIPNKKYLVVDGHHRLVASDKKGAKEIDAYVIHMNKDIKLGIQSTAEVNGIYSIDDIDIIFDDHHPLIQIITGQRKTKKDAGK